PACNPATGIARWHPSVAEPVIRAIEAADPMLALIGLSRPQAVQPARDGAIIVVRGDDLPPSEFIRAFDAPQIFLCRLPQVFQCAWTDVVEFPVRVGGPSMARHALYDQASFSLVPSRGVCSLIEINERADAETRGKDNRKVEIGLAIDNGAPSNDED